MNNERKIWRRYFIVNKIREVARLTGLPARKQVYKKEEINLADTNRFIARRIENGIPTMVARFGSSESDVLAEQLGVELGAKKKIREIYIKNVNVCSGLFPYGEKIAVEFSHMMLESVADVDLLAYWETYMQDYLINHISPEKMLITDLRNIEPYFYDVPWTAALEGKKVLVIHPFKDTIEHQYNIREKLFQNQNILPEFDLRVVKAVQTLADARDERFSTWFEALDYMYDEAIKVPFDVAIIGCGAYGFELASRIKRIGKVAVHMGGVTQILFGIKGKRWDSDSVVSGLYNEYWTRPLESEKPDGAKKVENACYW